MTLILSNPDESEILTFVKNMKLEEIKEIHDYFRGINSCNQFSIYLKKLVENKKLTISKKEDNFSLSFTVDYMFQNQTIELILSPKEINPDELSTVLFKEVNLLKERIQSLKDENKELLNIINDLKNENKNLQEEIKNINEEIKDIKNMKEQIKETEKLIEPINNTLKEININRYTTFNEKSVIMKENEFEFLNNAIKFRINKEIKEIKKLYQATVHGDNAQNFHSKCDGIPNTLVIIKSAGNRRFGGFTTKQWQSSDSYNYECDKNSFLFSFGKQTNIYNYNGNENYGSYQNINYAICRYKNNGPVFGGFKPYGSEVDNNFEIFICSNCIKQDKSSYTYETKSNSSYDFGGKKNNALSEDGKKSCIYIQEYEVFQVIFA